LQFLFLKASGAIGFCQRPGGYSRNGTGSSVKSECRWPRRKFFANSRIFPFSAYTESQFSVMQKIITWFSGAASARFVSCRWASPPYTNITFCVIPHVLCWKFTGLWCSMLEIRPNFFPCRRFSWAALGVGFRSTAGRRCCSCTTLQK